MLGKAQQHGSHISVDKSSIEVADGIFANGKFGLFVSEVRCNIARCVGALSRLINWKSKVGFWTQSG